MTTDQKQATPADELRRQIMNPNIPKNEREWWAAHEIERLAARDGLLKGIIHQMNCDLMDAQSDARICLSCDLSGECHAFDSPKQVCELCEHHEPLTVEAVNRAFKGYENRKAQSDEEPYRDPDDTKVICPNCTHQFRAISVADQARLRAQSDAEPVAWQCRPKCLDYRGREWSSCAKWQYDDPQSTYEYRCLYTAPPRPDALAQSDAGPLRCLITGNPCGTDTWEKNSPCRCINCQMWLTQSDAEPVATSFREGGYIEDHLERIAQSDAEPKGIDLDDADRAYDKWAEHRNGQSRLDAFRAGVEFGLRHTAPPNPDASRGISISDETLTIEWVIDGKKFGPKLVKVERPDTSGLIEALEQALDCIRGETPEDMSHEEARQDTIDKIRAVLNPRAADRSA